MGCCRRNGLPFQRSGSWNIRKVRSALFQWQQDDYHFRLVVQFVAMGLLILQLFLSARGSGLFADSNLLLNAMIVIIALIVCVNELKMSHPLVSVIYMALQLAVSLGFIFICPLLATSCGLPLVAWHWIYLAVAFVLLVVAYVLFKKKYYHLHEEYLASLKK